MIRVCWTDTDRVRGLGMSASVVLLIGVALAVAGMPPISIHSPLHFVGVMDPFCGMTRGIAATLRGDLRTAWWFNPASPLIVLATLVVVARSAAGTVRGRWLDVAFTRPHLLAALVGVALVVLEINQQLHVDRLR